MEQTEAKYYLGQVFTKDINGITTTFTIKFLWWSSGRWLYDLLKTTNRGEEKLITNVEEIYVEQIPNW